MTEYGVWSTDYNLPRTARAPRQTTDYGLRITEYGVLITAYLGSLVRLIDDHVRDVAHGTATLLHPYVRRW